MEVLSFGFDQNYNASWSCVASVAKATAVDPTVIVTLVAP